MAAGSAIGAFLLATVVHVCSGPLVVEGGGLGGLEVWLAVVPVLE